MLHVTIKDTTTDEVIYDNDVSAIALQAVDREKTSRLRHTSEDAEPADVFLCTRATIQEAKEVKKIISDAIEKEVGKTYFEINFDVGDDDAK